MKVTLLVAAEWDGGSGDAGDTVEVPPRVAAALADLGAIAPLSVPAARKKMKATEATG